MGSGTAPLKCVGVYYYSSDFPFPATTPKSSVNSETVTLESWQTGFQCSMSIMGGVIHVNWKRDEEEAKTVIKRCTGWRTDRIHETLP